jgi:hypothetical protein
LAGYELYEEDDSIGMGDYGGTDLPVELTVTTCWEALECAGQPRGDADCDGDVDAAPSGTHPPVIACLSYQKTREKKAAAGPVVYVFQVVEIQIAPPHCAQLRVRVRGKGRIYNTVVFTAVNICSKGSPYFADSLSL